MASIQGQKPVDHTKHHPHQTHTHTHGPVNSHNKSSTTGGTQPAPANSQNKYNFTTKVKDMANTAYKKVADQMHHHDQHGTGPRPVAGPKQTGHGSGGVAQGKKKDRHMSDCIPRIGDQRRKEKHTKKKVNDRNRKVGSSSSSSDSESDNDDHVKRK